jgi:hypothetical protein
VPGSRTRTLVAAAVVLAAAGGAVAAAEVAQAGPQARAAAARPTGPAPATRPVTAVADRASRVVPVAPLRRLTPPDLLVVARHPVGPRRVRQLRHRAGISAVTTADLGVVHVGRRLLHAVGVDPGAVRGFTPTLSARSDALWASVARGELTVSYAESRPFRRHFGAAVNVRHGRRRSVMRVGAFASLGIGRAQVVVDHVAARALGLRRDRLVLVSAPRLSLTAATAAVRDVLGPRVAVHSARPATVDQSQISALALEQIPAPYLALYRAAASTCAGLPWTVLAGIGAVETGHGADTSTSSKGAVGPMQFLPSTFRAYAVDGDGDGVADINDPADAIYSAARYLCLAGAGRGGQALYDAIWGYNHADWYVREVLRYAVAYA